MAETDGQNAPVAPLLETKTYVPRWRKGLVSRPRLVERLDRAGELPLTLVSAPAGFGKTTLLAEWLASSSDSAQPATWLSLDESDNDLALFWSYFIKALQAIRPGLGENTLSLLQSLPATHIESVLTTLINEISTIDHDFSLILDDYHFIDDGAIDAALTFFVEHLPQQMHLVIASRVEPSLPLARLRGRGALTDLRATDLRFTPEEAATFLNGGMGLDLSPGDVASLERRTEGWIAGLQLAALSMQGRDDASAFINAFAGHDRYIVDYLAEEVLQRQDEDVRRFLLQTSVLDRLSGPLCDAVTGQQDSKTLLETLERANLFVVPLDDRREWYRYHHLFADVLLQNAMEETPDLVPALHIRASDWYEGNGFRAEAIRHALAAEDFDRAASLIERIWPAINRSFEDATWLAWVKALPEEVVRPRPVLSIGYAFTALVAGELDLGAARLRDAERWLDADGRTDLPDVEMIVEDEEEFRNLPAMIASVHAFHCQATGDTDGAERYALQALDLLPEEAYFERAVPASMLGLAYWARGDLQGSYELMEQAMEGMWQIGNAPLALSGTNVIADLRIAQGRLRDALALLERAIRIGGEQGEPVMLGMADFYLGLCELTLEFGDVEAARKHLAHSQELSTKAAHESYQYRSRIVRARFHAANREFDAALRLIEEATGVFTESVVPRIQPESAMNARIWIAQGRLAQAEEWARIEQVSVDGELSYLHEYEHVTLARLLIAQSRDENDAKPAQVAVDLLERLLDAAEEGERYGNALEIRLQLALAHHAAGSAGVAVATLERALELAEPEGYCWSFVTEGEPMRSLLKLATGDGATGKYARRLVSAFDELTPVIGDGARPGGPAHTEVDGLPEQLTAREVEILKLIASGKRNQEIADELFITVSTVKRHIANAYGKLQVGHRTEAVARANELNLI